MKTYLIKVNDTDARHLAEAENWEDLKRVCREALGTDDIMVIKSALLKTNAVEAVTNC